ncbi:histidine kinase, partial [filamentous cyanobacterium CCP5]
ILALVHQYINRRKEAERKLRQATAKLEESNYKLKDSEGAYRQKAEALEQALKELRETQLKMVQSEKMSSLGQLVAGIAHEINNPVNFISGNLQHVEEYAKSLLSIVEIYQRPSLVPQASVQAEIETFDLPFIQHDFPKVLRSMNVGTDRIRNIVLSLRNFSRMDEAEFKSVDIHEGIESTLLILQYRLKGKGDYPQIQVVKNYGGLPPIECYVGLLNQVFMNILSNAIDALEDRSKSAENALGENAAQITIDTSVVEGNWARIAIADNGGGIPEQLRNKIFEPFFTTKPVGKGTGLGMSISYQIIVEKHQGTLECFSTPGQGTEFVITIPISHAP